MPRIKRTAVAAENVNPPVVAESETTEENVHTVEKIEGAVYEASANGKSLSLDEITARATRHAALSAMKSALEEELKDSSRVFVEINKVSGMKSFPTPIGQVNVSQRLPSFGVDTSDPDYIAFMIDQGFEDQLHEYDEPNFAKVSEIVEVLREHAPHLLQTKFYFDEWVDARFTAGLKAQKVTVTTPVMEDDGETPVMTQEVNPFTQEITLIPEVHTEENVVAVYVVKENVDQGNGVSVEKSVEHEVPFVTVKTSDPTVSYPASREQKIAKQDARNFFLGGNLAIAKQIVRPREIES